MSNGRIVRPCFEHPIVVSASDGGRRHSVRRRVDKRRHDGGPEQGMGGTDNHWSQTDYKVIRLQRVGHKLHSEAAAGEPTHRVARRTLPLVIDETRLREPLEVGDQDMATVSDDGIRVRAALHNQGAAGPEDVLWPGRARGGGRRWHTR